MFAFDTDKTFDILLLDIQMERMDGISLAKRLRKGRQTADCLYHRLP